MMTDLLAVFKLKLIIQFWVIKQRGMLKIEKSVFAERVNLWVFR
jgi:hypothetical protein